MTKRNDLRGLRVLPRGVPKGLLAERLPELFAGGMLLLVFGSSFHLIGCGNPVGLPSALPSPALPNNPAEAGLLDKGGRVSPI